MNQQIFYTEEDILHYGILGMRWGVRRYQPYPKGHKGGKEIGAAKRVSKRKILSNRETEYLVRDPANKSQRYDTATKSLKDVSDFSRETSKQLNQLPKKRKRVDVSSMNDEELKRAVNRLNMEKRYSELTNDDIETGMDKVRDILSVVGSVTAIGASAASIVAALNAMRRGD